MRLTAQDIHDAVNINSPALIKEIYDIANKQMQNEASRQTILDGKASALLSTVGLAVTLTFSFGCQIMLVILLRSSLASSADLGWGFSSRCSLLGIACAVSASACALLAVKVTGGDPAINERDVFNKSVIGDALKTPSDDYAVTLYRRYRRRNSGMSLRRMPPYMSARRAL